MIVRAKWVSSHQVLDAIAEGETMKYVKTYAFPHVQYRNDLNTQAMLEESPRLPFQNKIENVRLTVGSAEAIGLIPVFAEYVLCITSHRPVKLDI